MLENTLQQLPANDKDAAMLLTVEQAAERLGTSVRFIRRLRTEGRIPIVKLGKHIRIDSTDLDNFITAGRQEAWRRDRHDGAA